MNSRRSRPATTPQQKRTRSNETEHLTAREVAARADISLATVYAYVSRGLLRSEPVPGQKQHRYRKSDVDALMHRRELARAPQAALINSLDFGPPIVTSSISRIHDGALFLRDVPIEQLVTRMNVEQLACWLWLGDEHQCADIFSPHNVPNAAALRVLAESQAAVDHVGGTTVDVMQVMLPMIDLVDERSDDRSAVAVAHTGARLLRLLALSCLADATVICAGAPLAAALATGLRVRPAHAPLIDLALMVTAEHELNASTFTARTIASTRISPHQAVLGGICALRGMKHGGETERVELLFDATERERHPAIALRKRFDADDAPPPGFFHRLYPNGDPRARLLLNAMSSAMPDNPAVRQSELLCRVLRARGLWPTIDTALVTLRRGLRLPRGFALSLFALARSIGFLAHAIEERQQDRLIRPRARGVTPSPTPG